MFAGRFYHFIHDERLKLFHNVDDGIILFITYDSMIYEVAFLRKKACLISFDPLHRIKRFKSHSIN